jgi:hypothetical protein
MNEKDKRQRQEAKRRKERNIMRGERKERER